VRNEAIDTWLQVSVSYGKASAYLPVIELLRNYFDITVTDDEGKRREKVTGQVIALDRSLEDALPYLFSLLGIVDAGISGGSRGTAQKTGLAGGADWI
jgi:hypothetical protein